jgi:hypothetical protein
MEVPGGDGHWLLNQLIVGIGPVMKVYLQPSVARRLPRPLSVQWTCPVHVSLQACPWTVLCGVRCTYQYILVNNKVLPYGMDIATRPI